MRPRQTTRTFSSLMLRTVALRLVAFAAAAAIIAVAHALADPPSLHTSALPVEQASAPSWTLADASAYPDCVPLSAWPSGAPAAALVVEDVRQAGHHRLPFDTAWRRNHNRIGADDVWVLGVCSRAFALAEY